MNVQVKMKGQSNKNAFFKTTPALNADINELMNLTLQLSQKPNGAFRHSFVNKINIKFIAENGQQSGKYW